MSRNSIKVRLIVLEILPSKAENPLIHHHQTMKIIKTIYLLEPLICMRIRGIMSAETWTRHKSFSSQPDLPRHVNTEQLLSSINKFSTRSRWITARWNVYPVSWHEDWNFSLLSFSLSWFSSQSRKNTQRTEWRRMRSRRKRGKKQTHDSAVVRSHLWAPPRRRLVDSSPAMTSWSHERDKKEKFYWSQKLFRRESGVNRKFTFLLPRMVFPMTWNEAQEKRKLKIISAGFYLVVKEEKFIMA